MIYQKLCYGPTIKEKKTFPSFAFLLLDKTFDMTQSLGKMERFDDYLKKKKKNRLRLKCLFLMHGYFLCYEIQNVYSIF